MKPPSWTDRDGLLVEAPEPPASGSYYGPIGDFQGAEYDRNAFALGTDQEVAHLRAVLDLRPGDRVVDIGCGTGRHSAALAAAGIEAVGVDLSTGLLAAAQRRGVSPQGAYGGAVQGADPGRGLFVQADARALPLPDACANIVLSLCQGAFGITPGGDSAVLGEIARILRPGGRIALTAFSLAYAVRFLAPEDALDLRRGLVHSPAEVRGPDGARRTFDLWTACYSPGHLEMLLAAAGLHLEELSGVEPGRFLGEAPSLAHPELLAVAIKP